ncbi:flagellar assembly protein FliH [Alteribacillus sp. JSM 102045]|uniref:flagellar assembly protein FliH n=1 Tax=Alteribacillus sp. JSM 102045 TaxID=1562101 RepID=UPI0035C1DE20
MSRLIKAPNASSEVSAKRSIQLRPVTSRFKAGEDNAIHTEYSVEEVRQHELEEQTEKAKEEKKAAEKLKEQAERELEQARKQISDEEEESKQRIEQAFSEARDNGYKEGFAQGVKDGNASLEAAVEEVQYIITSAKEEYKNYLEKAEPVILELALAVANRVIYKSLNDEDGTWLEIVKNAVQEVKEHEEIAIHVPVSRYEETNQLRQEIENLLTHSEDLLLLPDSQLEDGQCIIETSYGRVDASLDSQLQELKTKLQERLKEGNENESSTFNGAGTQHQSI